MNKIAKYIRTCSIYQRVRVHHHKLYSELVSISLDSINSFYTIIMNFITDMPSARDLYSDNTHNAILILVDKLTKYVTYIVTDKELDASGLANIM